MIGPVCNAMLVLCGGISLANLVSFLSYAEVSDEGRYVIVYVSRGAEPRNKLYYCDLKKLDYKIEGKSGLS